MPAANDVFPAGGRPHNRSVFGNWCAECEACELTHRGHLAQGHFRGRVTQRKPILQQMDAKHGFQRIRFATHASLGIVGFERRHHASPRHDLIHLGHNALTMRLLAFADVLTHLAHVGC